MTYWNEFRGIKYGRKPVRFEKALSINSNSNEKDATEYGSQCVQKRTVGYPSPYYVGDEDCLFLNIMKRENSANQNLLPVFIWIHGGSSKHGNNTGDIWSETSRQYDGRFLALNENIVFVSINYRVNSFGYLIWKGDKSRSTWETEVNGKPVSFKYQNYFGNLAVYDAELAFQWVRRNIRHFGGDPDRITIGGASAGAGLASVVTSLDTVAPYIAGIIQQSGDALGPTTGFMPPIEWENDPLHNLETIAGYNNCDTSSETSMLDCLRGLDQYDLLKFSHKRSYRYINDGDFLNEPYMEMIKNSAHVPFLGGICDGDSVSFSPDWLMTPNAGSRAILEEYAHELTTDYGLPDVTADMLVYAYTNYTGHQRNADWSIRTMGAYMSTDWRYGAAIKHKMKLRRQENNSAKNYFYNFNHTNHYYYGDWDLNLATHIEERLYTFGAPFAMFDDFTNSERDLSTIMMKQWGNFIREQKVDWTQHPRHAYFDLGGMREMEEEAHFHSSSVWLDLILKENERNNCKSFIQCPYPMTTV